MGMDCYAKTIIGIKLPDEEDIPPAKKSVRKKAFKHDFEDDGEMEFHPKTGQKLWLEETEEIDADYPSLIIDYDDEYLGQEPKPGQNVVSIPEGLSTAYGTDQNSWYIGFVSETGSHRCGRDEVFESLPDINSLKDQLKMFLEPLGYWDEDKFGLYTVLHSSY